jgi:hypothetical protein
MHDREMRERMVGIDAVGFSRRSACRQWRSAERERAERESRMDDEPSGLNTHISLHWDLVNERAV